MYSATKYNVIIERTHPSGKEEPETINFKNGTTCVINGKNAPAGDIWLYLGGASMNEVQRCKLYGDNTQITPEKFAAERDKSCAPRDFFILFTSRRCKKIKRLLKNSTIVDSNC